MTLTVITLHNCFAHMCQGFNQETTKGSFCSSSETAIC